MKRNSVLKIIFICLCIAPLFLLFGQREAYALEKEEETYVQFPVLNDTEVIVNNYDGVSNSFLSFVEASKTDDFSGKTVSFTMEDIMVLDENFTGIGDADTPFAGTMRFNTISIKNLSNSYLFNNLSTSAQFTGNTLEMYAASTKTLTDKLTVVDGTTLDLSHFSIIEGTTISVGGSGVVANTLSGSGAVTISFGTMLNNIATINTTGTNAGLVTGILPAGITLTTSSNGDAVVKGSGATTVGGVVGLANGNIVLSGTNKFSADAGQKVGGVVGELAGSLTVTGTLTTNVTNANNYGGGLVARTTSTASVTATGVALSTTVNGGGAIGGIVGENCVELALGGINLTATVKEGKPTGGFIGTSLAGSDMTGEAATAKLTITGGWESITGGIIGDARAGENHLSVTVSTDSEITNQGTTGGVYGWYDDTNTDLLSPSFTLSNLKLNGAKIIGGFIGQATIHSAIDMTDANLDITLSYGWLNEPDKAAFYIGYIDTFANFSFTITKAKTSKKMTMFGTIETSSKIIDVVIDGGNKKWTFTDMSDSGLVLSYIIENSYIQLKNINVETNNDVPMIKEAQKGSVLEIRNATYQNSSGSVFVGKAGKGTAVYLNGTLTASKTKHIVKEIDESLVYANTANFSWATTTKSGWEVGSYGGVIKDRIGAGTPFIIFNESSNTVTLEQLSISDETLTIASEKEAVLYAITNQSGREFSAFGSISQSDLKKLKIKLSNSIDLSDTGIESFGPSNSSSSTYEYKGLLDGQGNTITLNIGKDYNGVLRTRTYLSKAYVGLFTKINSNTVQNLNLQGNINVASSAVMIIGTLASNASGVTLSNIHSTISINAACNNSENYVAGFLGESGDGTSITDCTVGISGTPVVVKATGTALGSGFIGKADGALSIGKDSTGSKVYATINAPGTSGGIIAKLDQGKTVAIDNITASINLTGKWNCGGVIGTVERSSESTQISITNSTLAINITNTNEGNHTGGIIGVIWTGTVAKLKIDNNILITTISSSGTGAGVVAFVNSEPKNNPKAQITDVEITNNTITADIASKDDSAFIMGRYINATSTAFNISHNTIKSGSIIKNTGDNGNVGGLVSSLGFNSLTEVVLTGTVVNGTIQSNSCPGSSYAGGLLGYEWSNVNVRLSGTHNLVNSSSGQNGGIVGKITGVLVVESTFTNTGSLTTTSGSTCGVVAVEQSAAMVFVKTTFAKLMGTITGKNEISVITELDSEMTTEGGLLSIELGGALGKMENASQQYITADSNWGSYFTRILTQNNALVRYYFNTYDYFYTVNTPKQKSASTITNASDLVYWHLRAYLFDNENFDSDVKDLFYSGKVNNITTSGEIDLDMTDYCFYPTKKQSSTMNFKNSLVTFGISNASVKALSTNTASQFYGLQYGFLLGARSTKEVASIVSISNLKLAGEFCSDDTYSGVLIMDTFSGFYDASGSKKAYLTLENIKLNGCKNSVTTNPLLIKKINQELDMTVDGISAYSNSNTESFVGHCNYTAVAASALFGDTGSETAVDLTITLSNVAVDSLMFSNALFFTSLNYMSGSKATYNFSQTEDFLGEIHIKNVTYGQEINLEDQDCYLNSEVYVNPTGVNAEYNFAANGYLYYCGSSHLSERIAMLLFVNRKKANLDVDDGFGTYRHPYKINNGGQLLVIANIISDGEISEGFIINFPSNVSAPTTYGQYQYDGTSFVKLSGETCSISAASIRTWLQGAYFSIEPLNDANTIDLTSTKFASFIGIGTIYYPFHGVVVGKNKNDAAPTVIMPSEINVTNTEFRTAQPGAGFINVSNGCAVHNLSLTYKDVTYLGEKTPTNYTNFINQSPTSSNIGTDYVYFGGVIGMQIGGDSSITSVSVAYNETTITSSHSLSIFGGLVGFIAYGGITFNDQCSVTLDPTLSQPSKSHLYFNKYVGKVLYAYAVELKESESSVAHYDNTNLVTTTFVQYQISAISKANAQIATQNSNGIKIDLANAEELFIFSLMTNSGYIRRGGIYIANTVRSRYYDYSGVGTIDMPNGLYSQDTYTSGSSPYICNYFSNGLDPNGSYYVSLVEGKTYDLSVYKNSYRPIGPFNAHSKASELLLKLFDGKSSEIILDVDLRQFAEGTSIEIDSITYVGLIGYTGNSPTLKNITITGTLAVRVIDENNKEKRNRFGTYCVGAVAGWTFYTIMDNIHIGTADHSMHVLGPAMTGGAIGEAGVSAAGTNDKCLLKSSVVNSKILSNTICGAFYGRLKVEGNSSKSMLYLIQDCSITSTDVIIASNENVGTIYAGGVAGKFEGNLYGTVKITNLQEIDSNVIIYCNISGETTVGGIVGCVINSGSNNNGGPEVIIENTSLDSTQVCAISSISNSVYLMDNSITKFDYDSKLEGIITAGYSKTMADLSKGQGGKSNDAGGFVGKSRNSKISISSSTFTSNKREVYILGLNNTGGFIGNIGDPISGNVVITDSSILATKNNIYLSGGPRVGGAVGFYKANGTQYKLILTNVKVEGNQIIDDVAQQKGIYITSSYNKSDKCASGGLVGSTENGSAEFTNCSVKYCTMVGRNSSIAICHEENSAGNLTISGFTGESCFVYGSESSAVFVPYYFNGITISDVHIANNIVCGASGCQGGIIAGLETSSNILAYNLFLHNNTLGTASFNFTGVTGANDTEKIINLVRSVNGPSGMLAKSTITDNGNWGYLVYSGTGKIRIYNIVRSEVSTTPATVKTMPDFKINGNNAVAVYLDYSIYDGTDNSFGAYKDFADASFDVTRIPTIVEEFGYLGETTDGDVNGESNALTTIEGKPLTIQYLNQDGVSDHKITTTAISIQQLNDITSLSFTDSATYQFAGIVNIQSRTDKINEDFLQYLDLLTNGGFSRLLTLDSGVISISSYRYSFLNGTISKSDGMNGSIVYNSGSKQFEFNSGITGGYDLLSGGTDLSFTILYITFTDGAFSYTFSVMLYYEQILEMDSHVVPIIGENYLISSYLGTHGAVQLDPTESLSLYIEYAYSDVANRIPFNFDKKLISVTNNGVVGGTSIPEGTKFKLIDISSNNPALYTMYYYTLDEDATEISLSDFEAADTFDYIPLADLSELSKITTNENFIIIERYILVVQFPAASIASDLSYFFVADETTKNNVRIQHDKGDGVATTFASFTKNVKLLASPSADLDTSYTVDPELKETFSNMSDDPLDAIITGNITIPYEYYTLAVGNKNLYGVYYFQLIDADHNVIPLPNGTEFVISTGSAQATLDVSGLSGVSYSIGEILTNATRKTTPTRPEVYDYELVQNVTVKFDFGKCSTTDFNQVFIQRALYTLSADFYLSTDEVQYRLGTKNTLDSLTYTANVIADIKVNMIPEDARHLGINVSSVEKDDLTNDGVIDFNLVADFSSLNDESIPENATLTFSLYRKDLVTGNYTYVPYGQNLPTGIVSNLGHVYYGDTKLTDDSVTLPVDSVKKSLEGKFSYKIDFPMIDEDTVDASKLLQTSYKLAVKVTYSGSQEKTYDTFFIFLIVNINTN